MVWGVGLFRGQRTAGNLALGGKGALRWAGLLLGFLLTSHHSCCHPRHGEAQLSLLSMFSLYLKDKESLLTTTPSLPPPPPTHTSKTCKLVEGGELLKRYLYA